VTSPGRFLAFDTSTERLSVGVAVGARQWLHEGPGAAQASATLIPAVLDLLAQAGLELRALDAIVFGRGPGSFTGLRTACAVAQGLAAGASLPVLPVDTLLAVAEEAAGLHSAAGHLPPAALSALLDARMDEVYAQDFLLGPQGWQAQGPCLLRAPEQLQWSGGPRLVVGNVFEVYAGRLPALPPGALAVPALPTARALLRLAPRLLAQGLAVPAAQALPLYVRDKVAQTTDERLAAKARAQQAG
jgi:tRNA threonylcarbamoyladenosine biosynthesis protein TsaB